jgi:hypothetical protein
MEKPMTILDDLARLGIEPPKDLVAAFGIRATANEVAYPTPSATLNDRVSSGKLVGEKLADAVRGAAFNGAVRAASEAIVRDLDRAFLTAENRGVREAGDFIVTALRGVAAPMLQRLAATVEMTGPAPDSRSMANAGPRVLLAYSEFRELLVELAPVRSVIAALHAARYLPVGPADAAAWLAPTTTDVAAARRAAEAGGDRLALMLGAGCELQVNTPDEVRLVLDAERAQAAELVGRKATSSKAANIAKLARAEATARAWERLGIPAAK